MTPNDDDTRSERLRRIAHAQAVLVKCKDNLTESKEQVKLAEQRVLDAMKALDKLVLKPPTRDRKGRLTYGG